MSRATAAALLFILLAVCAAASRPVPSLSQDQSVIVETNVQARMRDGVVLVADVYRPAAAGRYPVLLTRTPYNRRDPVTGTYLASHGYVTILQDTRGRFDSEGEFDPFRHEADDGYDTVEWAATLPYSNGTVGMFGGSYVGATQMLAASSAPPHLNSIYPYVTASEYYDGWTYQGGALAQWFVSSWTSGLAADTLRRKGSSQPKAWTSILPVDDYTVLRVPPAGDLAPYFRDWVQHETDDDYWKAVRVSDNYGRMTVKALHAGGWHDLFLKGSIKNFMQMRRRAATSAARSGQRLMVGPWAHARTSPEGKIGDVIFGEGAVLDMNRSIVEWADWSLKGVRNRWADGAPVRIFVMGRNIWRDEQEFPPARADVRRFYLSSTDGANSVDGDGQLLSEPAATTKTDVFEYDPMNPVPTVGGRLCCGNEIPPGPFDQRPIEGRKDVLVFSTPPLDEDLEVTGFLRLELYAATSAVDTDFTAIVADVRPDGYATFITDGIVRARFRSSTRRAEYVEPGKVVRYEIDLWATSNVFLAGHRIRLYVSSSNFPRFSRNLNTGEPVARATRAVKANQTVYHDVDRPSALVLPVIP